MIGKGIRVGICHATANNNYMKKKKKKNPHILCIGVHIN